MHISLLLMKKRIIIFKLTFSLPSGSESLLKFDQDPRFFRFPSLRLGIDREDFLDYYINFGQFQAVSVSQSYLVLTHR